MNKQRLAILILSLIIIAGVFIWLKRPETEISQNTNQSVVKPTVQLSDMKDREIIDQMKVPLKHLPAGVNFINLPSDDWEQKLTQSLKIQGGNSLKELEIKKERSLVWMRDENALLVESVVISMKNHQDVSSSFRALVDSQTGKVLETWDRTIFDPMDKSSELGFKLDPRYSN
jgi:hypothetical protein